MTLIYIIAGEASGDVLGARLIAAFLLMALWRRGRWMRRAGFFVLLIPL